MESQTVEYKRSWSPDHVRTLCAFANGSGGTMYIGIEDDGRPVGAGNIKGLLDDIPNTVWARLRITADVQAVSVGGKNVVRIRVEPHRSPVLLNGQTFVRIGSSTFRIEGEALARFIVEHGSRDWLELPSEECGVPELSAGAIAMLIGSDGPVPYEERLRILYRLDLVRRGSPTMAAALLLHRKPRRFSVGAYIRIARFDVGKHATRSTCIDGPCLLQPRHAMEAILERFVPDEYVYEGMYRLTRRRFPPEALEELLTNAVQHRDYVVSSPVTVEVHQSGITVSNPCVPPDPDAEPLPPNPGMARMFREAGLAASWGRGIQRANEVCMENGNPPVDIRRTRHGRVFVAMLRDGRKDARRTVASEKVFEDRIDRTIFDAVREDGGITPKRLSGITGLSESTVRRRLRRMEERRVLSRRREGGATVRMPVTSAGTRR